MKVFVIGDTHFNHVNIIKYCNRPFEDIEDMNNQLIKNWNDTAGKKDIVIHVGDIALGNRETTKNFVSQLKGRKWLVMGNHDNFNVKDYYDMGFEFVSPFPFVYKNSVLISHYPIANSGLFNIHGHVHDNPLYQTRTDNSWCVSVERTNYKPVELKIEEFENFSDPFEIAQGIRKDTIENGEHNLGFMFGSEVVMIINEGRIFVQLEYGSTFFREEYSSSKTDLASIKEKVIKILQDSQHPFTLKIRSKFLGN